MTALVEVDVIEAWQRLEAEDLSPTAHLSLAAGS
jgi:hypothetical protein